MNPTDRVAEILTSSPIGNLHFTCGQQITPSLFSKVANALKLPHAGIKVVPVTALPADAKYDEKSNQLQLLAPYNDADYQQTQMRALVVHECVHAIADIQKLNLNRSSTEAAGFLAQTLYTMLRSSSHTIVTSAAAYGGDQQLANIFKKCRDIVTKYNLLNHSAVVSHNDVNDLKNIIHAIGVYNHQWFWDLLQFDGVKGVSKH